MHRLLVALALVTAAASARPAAAAVNPIAGPSVRDSTAGRDTTVHVAPAPPDTGRADSTSARAPLRWSEQPRMVMLRSALVPGWGQWHNHAYYKAVAVAGTEGWILGGILSNQRAMNRFLEQADAARRGGDEAGYVRAASEYNDRLDRFVSGQWLLAGVLTYALVDAYVDAHFRTFDVDFRTDPALPGDEVPDPSPTRDAPPARRNRLSLRWHF